MQAHIDTEDYLRHTCARSGIRFTILREGIYAESYPLYLGFFDARAQHEARRREVLVPQTQKQGIAWVSRNELGEATARILVDISGSLSEADGGQFADKVVLLSGPSAVSLEETGAAVSEILGWVGNGRLQVHEVSEDEFVKHHAANRGGGKDAEDFVRAWASTFPAIASGELAVVGKLQNILGRKPREFREILSDLLQDITDTEESIAQYAK